ncbi:hypothetical protein IWQ62_004403 [Dispira parvispora]|uniref:Cytochrome P450 n=1 Tax=Dispira parvispora TaxID=1520584 RepID=A0A9W8ALZ5_9FUNG|nr:hypothetical protein IWQ62_004403 [Dispira parvispora]
MLDIQSGVWLVLGIGLLTYVVKKLFMDDLSRVPGPLMGKLLPFWMDISVLTGHYTTKLRRLHEKYGPVVQIGSSTVIVLDPDVIPTIYGTHRFRKSPTFYETFRIAEHHLFSTSDPKLYAERHKIVASIYGPASLRKLEQLVYGSGPKKLLNRVMAKYEEKSGPVVVDFFDEFRMLTFSVIVEIAMGGEESFRSLNVSQDQLLDWFNSFALMQGVKLVIPVLGYDSLYRYCSGLFYGERGFHKYALQIIELRRQRIKNHQADPDRYPAPPQDVVQAFLEARHPETGEKLSDSAMATEIAVQLISGFETTSTALTWFFYALLIHPEVHDKVIDELLTTFPDRSKPIKAAEITQKLPYLDALIHETLRVYAPAAFAFPRLVPDGGITIQGHHIPEGMDVGISVYSWHHYAEAFPDPDTFNPERFLGPEGENNKRKVMAFLTGVRQCIGRRLAMMEIQITLVHILRELKLSPVESDLASKPIISFPIYYLKDKKLLVRVEPRPYQ